MFPTGTVVTIFPPTNCKAGRRKEMATIVASTTMSRGVGMVVGIS